MRKEEYKNRIMYLLFSVLFAVLCLCFCFPMLARAEGMITIDANRKYEGMENSFAKGYEPSIKKNTMTVVVPFLSEAKIKDDKIIVGVSFEREENSPFYYKNYQKKVKKSQDGVYLYQCKIKLKEDRVNGQYPLHLSVQAQSEEDMVYQNFTIYVEITDGRAIAHTGAEGEENISEKEMPQESNFSQDVPLDSSVPEEEKKMHQPRMMILENSLQGNSLLAGESTLWSLSAKNCSNSQSVENMKITLISENKDIFFEKTSWYFAKTQAGKTVDLSQNIMVGRKVVPEYASLQFQFEYEDKDGNSYTSTETVKLSVSQPQEARLVDLSFPESIYESDKNPMTFQIQNTGLAVIYNVRVRLEGRGLFPEKELFLGNIEGGTSSEGELQVFAGTLDMDAEGEIIEGAEKYGDTSGKVIFSYENEQGEVMEQVQEIHTSVKKPQMVELKIEKEVQKTNQWWITIIILIFLVLIFGMIWLYLRMRYYKNRGKS